jgi:hypothetical protein
MSMPNEKKLATHLISMLAHPIKRNRRASHFQIRLPQSTVAGVSHPRYYLPWPEEEYSDSADTKAAQFLKPVNGEVSNRGRGLVRQMKCDGVLRLAFASQSHHSDLPSNGSKLGGRSRRPKKVRWSDRRRCSAVSSGSTGSGGSRIEGQTFFAGA